MSKRLFSTILSIVCLVMAGLWAQAQQQGDYRGTYQSVRQLILQIENRTDAFSNSVQAWLDNNPSDVYSDQDINLFVRDFDDGVRRLAARLARRESTALDVQEVLNRATRI